MAICWLVTLVLLAALANWLPVAHYSSPVGPSAIGPQWDIDLLLGTDRQGRSLLSRLIYGARASLLIGLSSTMIAFLVGTTVGLIAGYLRGSVDWVATFVAEVILSFPTLVLLLALVSIYEPSVQLIFLALAFVATPIFIRLARANALTWAERDFVNAARNLGAGRLRIMAKEILPNLLPGLLAYVPVVIAVQIIAEGSLSFLGFGIPPPTPSWGRMISEGKFDLATKPVLVFLPALVMFLTILSLNTVGDYLQGRRDRSRP